MFADIFSSPLKLAHHAVIITHSVIAFPLVHISLEHIEEVFAADFRGYRRSKLVILIRVICVDRRQKSHDLGGSRVRLIHHFFVERDVLGDDL